jgi:hypothetical protein
MAITVKTNCPVCDEKVTWQAWEEMYGADADGNRGMMQTEAEVIDPCPLECEWTDKQENDQFEAALQAYEDQQYGDCPY